jgi:sulfur-oxidizing protein SoxB
MNRREFLRLLAVAGACGVPLLNARALEHADGEALYDLPPFGNVSLLHFTDAHAQLLPLWSREPAANLGFGAARGRSPHVVGEQLLRLYGIAPGSLEAHALSCVDFVAAARVYGKTGGFAAMATLVQRLRASRPGALLLDGGDTWQGSGTALWTRGADMVAAQRLYARLGYADVSPPGGVTKSYHGDLITLIDYEKALAGDDGDEGREAGGEGRRQ